MRLERELLEEVVPKSHLPVILGENFLHFLNGHD